jgi:hypothetical protein
LIQFCNDAREWVLAKDIGKRMFLLGTNVKMSQIEPFCVHHYCGKDCRFAKSGWQKQFLRYRNVSPSDLQLIFRKKQKHEQQEQEEKKKEQKEQKEQKQESECSYYVHKALLVTFSVYFQTAFYGSLPLENNQTSFVVHYDFDSQDVLNDFIDYF